jgi:hypothetical protein
MKSFYKIENGKALVGSGIKVPEGFIEYTDEPQELTHALALEQQTQDKIQRIAELKSLLASTDYVALPDYDKDKQDILAQRQAWRDEIRTLEANQ